MMEESDHLRGEERPEIFSGMIKIDVSYFNTWLGRVKILELLIITFAGCILPSVIGVFFTRYSFYTFVVWTGFMYIVVDLLLHVTSLWQRLPDMLTSSTVLFYPVLIGALAFLLSSSLVASVSDQLYPRSRATRSGISSACGLITTVLFLIESFLHYKNQNECNELRVPNTTNGGERVIISGPIRGELENPPPYTEDHGTYRGEFV